MQAEVRRPRCRKPREEPAVKIRVHDAADLNGLIAFLEERDYVAEQVGPNMIEVSRLSSVRHDHVRMELDLFLKAWHVAHPEAHAEFVEQA
jgi:hypothetical protein